MTTLPTLFQKAVLINYLMALVKSTQVQCKFSHILYPPTTTTAFFQLPHCKNEVVVFITWWLLQLHYVEHVGDNSTIYNVEDTCIA